MFFATRVGLSLAVLSTVALGGCSMGPFEAGGSEAAVAAARAEGGDLVPRLRPRAIGVCYGATFSDSADVEAEAAYLCEGGRLVKQDEDFFWNGCSLTQPHRVSYICYPPDKAKRQPSESN